MEGLNFIISSMHLFLESVDIILNACKLLKLFLLDGKIDFIACFSTKYIEICLFCSIMFY